MELSTIGNPGRAKRKFPASDDRLGNRDGIASPRTDAAVIKKITGVGLEVVDVNRPPTVRNGYAKLMLFVTLAAERDEPAVIDTAKLK